MKKYIDKLKDLKNTNKKLFIGIISLFVFVGVTFAFVAAQISGGAFKLFNLGAQTTDQLEFVVDKDLTLTATQFNFVEGGNNLSDTSIATARLKANSTKNTASYNYNVYLVIEENGFVYTTTDKKPEVLLQVTNPNGNPVTTLDGLTYNTTLQGFDITEEQGILAVAENFNISSSSSTNWTSQDWAFTVTFINLDTNQEANTNKQMIGKIKIQQLTEVGNDITVAVNNLPEAYGPLATLNCKGSDSVYNQQYNRIEVSNISKNQSFCNVTYNDRTEKQYLNDYIMGLEGTTQGDGVLVHETLINGDYTTASKLQQSEYGSISQYYNTNNYSEGSESNAFSYINDEWISSPSTMDENTYYIIEFTIPNNGYYQMCYEISNVTSSYQQHLTYSDENQSWTFYLYEGGTRSECQNLGYLTSGMVSKVTQYSGTNIATIKFSIQKENTKNFDLGYRYEGSNPNNYIWFNNELWRIIGVMNEESHGQFGLNLVKIIRNNSIGSLVFNNSYNTDWNNSSLKRLLNGAYYNQLNGTETDGCYAYYNLKSNCDYRISGLQKDYRKMVKEVEWKYNRRYHQGLHTAFDIYTFDMRGNNIDNGFIGLVYASDYGYSTIKSSCPRNQRIDSNACISSSWIPVYASELMLAVKSDGDIYNLSTDSAVISGYNSYYYDYAVRPVLYLKENIYLVGGDGSMSNPYIIGM